MTSKTKPQKKDPQLELLAQIRTLSDRKVRARIPPRAFVELQALGLVRGSCDAVEITEAGYRTLEDLKKKKK